jgi:hypothetical protein
MEYRFRGWDAVGYKGWVYGDLVHNKRVDLTDRVMVGGYEVVPESVGLWTGLKDKNGKEIFEGDWVLLEGVGVFNVRYSTSMCQFGLYERRGFVDALKELQADRYEVVGNIMSGHKNKE